jgi:hypothetical protein
MHGEISVQLNSNRFVMRVSKTPGLRCVSGPLHDWLGKSFAGLHHSKRIVEDKDVVVPGLRSRAGPVTKKMSQDARIMTAAAPTSWKMIQQWALESFTGNPLNIEPAFWCGDDIPDFARIVPDTMGQTDGDNELCDEAFSACVEFLIPRLAFLMSLNDALFRPFRYCYRIWKDGAVAFLHDLMRRLSSGPNLVFLARVHLHCLFLKNSWYINSTTKYS